MFCPGRGEVHRFAGVARAPQRAVVGHRGAQIDVLVGEQTRLEHRDERRELTIRRLARLPLGDAAELIPRAGEAVGVRAHPAAVHRDHRTDARPGADVGPGDDRLVPQSLEHRDPREARERVDGRAQALGPGPSHTLASGHEVGLTLRCGVVINKARPASERDLA